MKPRLLLMDANVLIDYQGSDFSVLGLVGKHLGEVHVLTTILDEVEEVDVVDCERLGLRVIEPELIQLQLAAARRGTLSFADHLCLVVASDGGLVCVTNDRSLRRACEEEDVAVLWGLEMMMKLVRKDAMQAAGAIRIAEAIHQSNPLHIPRKLVEHFARIVTELEKNSPDR